MSKFTEIQYLYTDASGFGTCAVVYVTGSFSKVQLANIDEKLDDGEFFIPTEVGLDSLQASLSSFPSNDDHVWHTLNTSRFSIVNSLPEGGRVVASAQDMAKKFEEIEYWNIHAEMSRLGLRE